MKPKKIDGHMLTNQLTAVMAKKTTQLIQAGIVPGLAIIQIGNDEASSKKLRELQQLCDQLSVRFLAVTLSDEEPVEGICSSIGQLSSEPAYHGIALLDPVPAHTEQVPLFACIPPARDVAGLSPHNQTALLSGKEQLLPCGPLAVLALLEEGGVSPAGKTFAVVGDDVLMARPLSRMLLNRDATVTLCPTENPALEAICHRANVVISCANRPRLIGRDHVGQGAVVVDAGLTLQQGKWVGDVHERAVSESASLLCPVPGGVDALWSIMLLENTIAACAAQTGFRFSADLTPQSVARAAECSTAAMVEVERNQQPEQAE